MTLLTNSFEGGTNGTTITTGNSGGASGNAFDTVDGTPTFSSTQAAHGSLSASLPATSGNSAFWWQASLTGSSLGQVWWRAYVWLNAVPSNLPTIIEGRYSGGIGAYFCINSSGNLEMLGQPGSPVGTSSTVLPTSAWFRLEGFITGSATAGQMETKIFLTKDSVTPTETVTSASNINTGGGVTALRYGEVNEFGGTGAAMFVDDLGASTTGYIGPVVTAAPSGMLIASII